MVLRPRHATSYIPLPRHTLARSFHLRWRCLSLKPNARRPSAGRGVDDLCHQLDEDFGDRRLNVPSEARDRFDST
ncbi:hypothetical protein EVAR_3322_1 [Eumeta japonica]|uniref:Uncharacterized protein n=1 Tax=Eumeta variegata TaxID=151549 RepID=A0A4C1SV34_EUMVA|nr:hypothetical protein EVAR_3322_1 [Eumeta japonica]